MSSFFVIDVESIGLHGEGFAVGGGVFLDNGAAQWEFRLSCPSDLCSGTDEDRKWVGENVPEIGVTHRSPKAMRDEFWKLWMKAKAYGAVMAAECLWPVEAGFVRACVADDPSRNWEGPYPFYEISTYMAAAGMEPLALYSREPSELPAHDPLADARQSARLLSIALGKLNK